MRRGAEATHNAYRHIYRHGIKTKGYVNAHSNADTSKQKYVHKERKRHQYMQTENTQINSYTHARSHPHDAETHM